MIGLALPDHDEWSERVVVALGQNPGAMTGPGTNTYLIGTGRRRILLDTGQGLPAYTPVLEAALEQAGCDGIQEIVLTHSHPDHIGGTTSILERFGPLQVSKWIDREGESPRGFEITPLDDGAVVRTEGATLRAIHTPGHARDHLCFLLEEEQAIFSGDNVLGVGTTVIPDRSRGGDLLAYMRSLERLLAERPGRIYPAHGPVISDGQAKLREYIDHRHERERQMIEALRDLGPCRIPAIVKHVYTDVPEILHRAAALSVGAHLVKLAREERATYDGDGDDPQEAVWRLL